MADFPRLGGIKPSFESIPYGAADPVLHPMDDCQVCGRTATRRVWLRFDERVTCHDSVAVCDDHAKAARRSARSFYHMAGGSRLARAREDAIAADMAEVSHA